MFSLIDETDGCQRFQATVNFFGKIEAGGGSPDIEPAENAGNGHECQKCGNNEKYEGVSGVHRRKTEQQGNPDV